MAHRPNSLVIRSRVEFRKDVQKDAFINALERVHTVAVATRIAGLTLSTVYLWRKEDANFAQRWLDAIELSKQALESATYLKAIEGKSPAAITASIFLLKGMYPEKYADRVNMKTTNVHLAIDWDNLPEEITDDFLAGKLTTQDVYDLQLRLRSGNDRQDQPGEGTQSATETPTNE